MVNTSIIFTLLLVVLLYASAAAESSDLDGICKSMVETQGYVCQEHNVITKDGYILGIQRIPMGRQRSNNISTDRPVVLLQHGLLGEAYNWIFNSPNESLAFILADEGYDVWLANNRGTISSRGHTSLSTNDPAYWEWTWVELANYDLQATFEYVHSQTDQKLHFVGHSLGTLLGLTAFSQHKLLDMTRSATFLCPISYLGNLTSLFARTIADSFLAERIYMLGIREFSLIPNRQTVGGQILEGACNFPLIDCTNLIADIGGPNCCLNSSMFHDFIDQSTSTKNIIHLTQMIRKGNLEMYDYGIESENEAQYGQPTPPAYNLTRIPNELPIFLSYGGRDSLTDVKDVQILLDNLKDHKKDKLVVQYIEDYAHFDFIFAVNANRLVYDPLMAFFRSH